jgi:5-methylcytosine-specific restriction enzyme subunit McrC
LPAEFQDTKLLPQAYGANRYLASRDSRNVFQLRPDLALQSENIFPLLIDLKYKHLDTESRRLGVVPSDFYQMFAYAHRYDCQNVLLFYPQTADMPEPVDAIFTIQNSDKRVSVATVDLRRDLSSRDGQSALVAQLNHTFHSVMSGKKESV